MNGLFMDEVVKVRVLMWEKESYCKKHSADEAETES
jgi:hypothetical protein